MEDIIYEQPSRNYSRSGFREEIVEDAAVAMFRDLGYEYADASQIAPDGTAPERTAYSDVILTERLMKAVERLNPKIPVEARTEAIKQLFITETPSLVEENRRIHRLLTEGVDVEFHVGDGEIRGDKVWLIDFDHPDNNDWLVTNQFTVVEGRYNRRPDIVVFLNGLPLAVIELKNAGAENAHITGAFNQLQTYKAQIPALFRTNAVLVASDGMLARIGSLTADEERFMPWRTVTGANGDFTPHGPREMETLLRGIFDKGRFLALLRDFIVFGDKGDGPFKIIAGYHQFHGAMKALEKKNLVLEALRKLINGEIRSRSRSNVVEAKTFSQRLEEAVARYHASAISTVEMIQELIALAKDIKASAARGEEHGLSPEELAFYDALAENESAVEAMGSEQLRIIAHELVEQMRASATVDWHHKASARARMRVLVKRVLKKYGYPPDLEQAAIQTVLAQAETLLREVATR